MNSHVAYDTPSRHLVFTYLMHYYLFHLSLHFLFHKKWSQQKWWSVTTAFRNVFKNKSFSLNCLYFLSWSLNFAVPNYVDRKLRWSVMLIMLVGHIGKRSWSVILGSMYVETYTSPFSNADQSRLYEILKLVRQRIDVLASICCSVRLNLQICVQAIYSMICASFCKRLFTDTLSCSLLNFAYVNSNSIIIIFLYFIKERTLKYFAIYFEYILHSKSTVKRLGRHTHYICTLHIISKK